MICDKDSPAYKEIREKAAEAIQAGKLIGLPMLCAVLAKYVGPGEALITPFVARLVQTGVTVDVKVWYDNQDIPNVKVDVEEKKGA